jgi:hypothetical protein
VQFSNTLSGGVTLTDASSVADFAFGVGGNTMIDFGQGDSVMLYGVSYEDVAADPSKFFSVV